MAHERILIVEDEPPIVELIEEFLGDSGYDICGAVATGAEAVVETGRLQPDLILMDIGLRGPLDGVETAQRLQKHFDIPIIFLTGMQAEETLHRTQSARASGFLLKPFRREELQGSIGIALQNQKLESKLRKIENWFSAAIKSITDGVITTDNQSIVTFINPVASTLTGWRPEDAVGRPLDDLFRIADVQSDLAIPNPVSQVVTHGLTVRISGPIVLRSRHQVDVAIEASGAPIRNEQGQIIGIVLIFRDVTERQNSEAALSSSREQLRSLAAHLQSVREEERTRISREIHDQLGQMVTGLKMDLTWMERRLSLIEDPAVRAPFQGKIQSMSALLVSMIQSVRKLSAELRPGILDDLGLIPALEWQAREFQNRTGIPCTVRSVPEDLSVPPEIGTVAFRIFQETLTNVARHAQATSVTAHLEATLESLLMTVTDNGRAITDTEIVNSKSFGLLGMRERAAILGGDFKIVGEPGHGTTVTVRIPLRGSE